MSKGVDEKGLGLLLQKARKSAGYTQQQLCHDAGLSYSTLAKIERGAIKAPSIFTIQRIAEVLETPLDTLLNIEAVRTRKTAKKRSKSGIRFIYFDINGCLVRFFHRAFTDIAEITGAPADVIETVFWHYNDAVCRGEMPLAEFNDTLAKRLGVDSFDWQKHYLAAVDPIKEMDELVAWAAEHYEIGLLSNIMPGFIQAMLTSGLIPDADYKAVIDSSVEHTIKPETKIYEIAEAKAGVPAGEILLVDDSRANLMAAEHMGWKVLWFDDFDPQASVDKISEALEFS